jgi:hypothetical protein
MSRWLAAGSRPTTVRDATCRANGWAFPGPGNISARSVGKTSLRRARCHRRALVERMRQAARDCRWCGHVGGKRRWSTDFTRNRARAPSLALAYDQQVRAGAGTRRAVWSPMLPVNRRPAGWHGPLPRIGGDETDFHASPPVPSLMVEEPRLELWRGLAQPQATDDALLADDREHVWVLERGMEDSLDRRRR